MPAQPHRGPSRRSFLGKAVAAGAVAAGGGVVAAAKLLSGPGAKPEPASPGKSHTAAKRVPENSRPGDPDWWIQKQGPPDAMTAYAGQASVRPGEPVQLYVSTTSRDFKVKAFRVGWYDGDLARKVWQSRPA